NTIQNRTQKKTMNTQLYIRTEFGISTLYNSPQDPLPAYIETQDKTSLTVHTNLFAQFDEGATIKVFVKNHERKQEKEIGTISWDNIHLFVKPFPLKSGSKGYVLQLVYHVYFSGNTSYYEYQGENFRFYSRKPKHRSLKDV